MAALLTSATRGAMLAQATAVRWPMLAQATAAVWGPTAGTEASPVDPLQFVSDELAALEERGLYRQNVSLEGPPGPVVERGGRWLVNFSSNDYLALANDQRVRWGAASAALRFGGGAGASRLLGGDLPVHRELEAALAVFKNTEAALLFGSGTQANTGTLAALLDEGDALFSDALNHASIIDGARLSRAKRHVYSHLDLSELESLLSRSRARRKLIVTESLFSMDGDVAPLRELSELAARFGALLMVDEAHATGLYGAGGAGLCEELGVANQVHLQMGTLGKALGAAGAYVAGERRLVDFLLNRARSYVFATAPAPAACGAALAALQIVRSEEGATLRTRLHARAGELRAALWREAPAGEAKSTSGERHLLALRLGDPRAAVEASDALERAGFLVRAVRPPTVPEGTSRLRLCLSAGHSQADVAALGDALRAVVRHEPIAPRGCHEAAGAERQRALRESDFQHLWHPFTQMQAWFAEEPLVIERGEGVYLFDVQGRRYLDGISSLWACLHGHRRPEIDAAVAEQLTRVAHSTLLGQSGVPAIELAAALVKIAPPGLTRVFYSDSGSTAVEIALKMAFQYQRQRGEPQRHKFLAFGEAYHGDTVGAVSAGGIDLFHEIFRQLLFEVVRAPSPHLDRDAGAACALIAAHASELAAVVIEPLVQGAGGMLLQAPGYLRKLRAACDTHGVLLITDEVATGFGRTGTMFAAEQEGVVPDLMCVAKGISGGYLPLAATLTREVIFEGFLGSPASQRTFFHGHTYTGNALACAAALASLRIFETDHTLSLLQPKIARLRSWLGELRGHPHVAEVRQCGFMVGIELCAHTSPRKGYPAASRVGHQVALEARRRGAILRPLGDVVVLMPPLSISQVELDELLAITRAAIDAITTVAAGAAAPPDAASGRQRGSPPP